MNKLCFLILLFLSYQLYAENITDAWHCTAEDEAHKQWTSSSNYERAAVNKAFEQCKKESQFPESCKTSHNDCDYVVNGYSTKPMWQCKAMDQMAKIWPSNFYAQRDDAAIAAKAYCQQRSSFPDTCYINLITCKNVNEQDK